MKKYISFEQALENFRDGDDVWYELEDGEITQEMWDNDDAENGQYDDYKVGDIMCSCYSKALGDKIKDLDRKLNYFEIK